LLAKPDRLFDLLRRHVDPDDAALLPDLHRSGEHVHPRAAAEVKDALTLSKTGEVEEVADSGERLDRVLGNTGQQVDGVAQPLGQGASYLEVVIPVRMAGHMAVHVPDLRL